MSTRKINFSTGEFYHIYNRGTDKRDIFIDKEDWDRFHQLLYVSNSSDSFVFRELPIGLPYVKFKRGESLTSIGAYCLMPNHFHILVKETKEKGISSFMNKLLTSYSSYFNKKYQRSGRLFENTFRATHANSDDYLKYLLSYIHLNPVKMINPKWKESGVSDHPKTLEYLAQYKHSSYPDYIGLARREACILDRLEFPEYFSTFKEFTSFINHWLKFKSEQFT